MTRGSLSHSYDYVPACSVHPNYQGHQLILTMRQQPVQARVSTSNERDRKPIEPPPIIQIQLNHAAPSQEMQDFLQNPYFFMYVNLVNPGSKELVSQPDHQTLSGQTVSSMYKLKDITDQDGGFFCFGDLSSRIQGEYQLKFSLFEIVTDGIINLMHTFSNVFKVYNSKTMPGLIDATFLSRSFSDQGVRIRIRKEHRVQVANSKKRKQSAEEQDDHDHVAQSPPPYERNSRHSSLSSHHFGTNPPTPIFPTTSTGYCNTSSAHHRKHHEECITSLIFPTHTYINTDPIHAHSFTPTPHPYELRSRQNSLLHHHHHHHHMQDLHPHDHRHPYHRHSGPTPNTLSPPSMTMGQQQQQRYRRQSTDDKIMFPLSPRPSIEATTDPPPNTSDFQRRRSITSSLSTTTTELTKEGWTYHRYSPQQKHAPFRSTPIKPPPSPTNSNIRLPPLHTMIPHTDITNDDGDNNNDKDFEKDRYNRCDDKSDVGHVNAAVAMMQLSQHRQMGAMKDQDTPENQRRHHHYHHPCDNHLLDPPPSRHLSTDTLDRSPC